MIKVSKRIQLMKILSIAVYEYVRWITNPKCIIIIVMAIFSKALCIDPLIERAIKFNGELNVLEPFIAVGNSGMLVMLMPAVYLVLMSDFPKLENNSLFFLIRSGKINWLIGQMIFSIMSILSFLLITFFLICTFSINNSIISTSWSEVTRLYVSRFPNEYDSFASQLLPSNLYNQLNIIPTFFYTFSLMTLYLFLLSEILLMFRISALGNAGMFANLCVIAIGAATCSIKSNLLWLFPMGNTIIWLHYTEIMKETVMPILYSYLYFIFFIIILIIICIRLTNKTNFLFEEDI